MLRRTTFLLQTAFYQMPYILFKNWHIFIFHLFCISLESFLYFIFFGQKIFCFLWSVTEGWSSFHRNCWHKSKKKQTDRQTDKHTDKTNMNKKTNRSFKGKPSRNKTRLTNKALKNRNKFRWTDKHTKVKLNKQIDSNFNGQINRLLIADSLKVYFADWSQIQFRKKTHSIQKRFF